MVWPQVKPGDDPSAVRQSDAATAVDAVEPGGAQTGAVRNGGAATAVEATQPGGARSDGAPQEEVLPPSSHV